MAALSANPAYAISAPWLRGASVRGSLPARSSRAARYRDRGLAVAPYRC